MNGVVEYKMGHAITNNRPQIGTGLMKMRIDSEKVEMEWYSWGNGVIFTLLLLKGDN